jgi:hypothetical protein
MRGFAFGTGPEVRVWEITGHRDRLRHISFWRQIPEDTDYARNARRGQGAGRRTAAAGILKQAGSGGARR